jgi:hypothetical protein
MKTLSYFLTLSLLAVICFNCHKDKPSNVLPPATTDGLNTIGFLVNGQVWTPFYKCTISTSPCGKIMVRYGVDHGAPPRTITMAFGREPEGKPLSYLIIDGLNDYTSSNKYSITTTGDKIDSIHVLFQGGSNPQEYVGPFDGSSFIITKLDFDKRIISGTFHFFLQEYGNGDNKIELMDGRFDLKLDACECH